MARPLPIVAASWETRKVASDEQVVHVCLGVCGLRPQKGQPYPYGSVIVMETYRARADAQNNPLRDGNGRFIRDTLAGIFVMRKERGFGVEYEHNRTGEWEYVAYIRSP